MGVHANGTSLEQRLAHRLQAIRARMVDREHSIAAAPVRIEQYLELLDSWTLTGFYAAPPPKVLLAAERIRAAIGSDALGRYHQEVLRRLIERAIQRAPGLHNLAPAWHHVLRAYYLILGGFELEPPARSDWPYDNFCKDLNVALLRMIPTGTMVIERRSAFSRRAASAGGMRGIARGIAILTRLGGHAPLYEQHLYTRFLTHLTPAAWVECLRCTAELLERDPVVRGVFGGGWLWDPALDAVSPRIAFLRAIPAAHGAMFIPLPPSADALDNALSNAPERRLAYEAGQYRPRNYLMIWSRRDLLRWANRVRAT